MQTKAPHNLFNSLIREAATLVIQFLQQNQRLRSERAALQSNPQ